jgi:hypothetical protein
MAKQVRRLSSLTTRRENDVTSPGLARNFMNFRFDHRGQRDTRPNRLGCTSEGFRTSGGPFTFGVGEALGENGPDGMKGPRNDPGNTKV